MTEVLMELPTVGIWLHIIDTVVFIEESVTLMLLCDRHLVKSTAARIMPFTPTDSFKECRGNLALPQKDPWQTTCCVVCVL